MKKLFLHPLAIEEMMEAKNFYNSKVNGLGNHLFEEIDRAIALIEEAPETLGTLSYGLHRFLLKRFPFTIIYRIKEKHYTSNSIYASSPKTTLLEKTLKLNC